MNRTGSCLCGTVRYKIADAADTVGACHCSMCRKWSGGVYLATHSKADQVQFTGEDQLKTYASSPWAERGFCQNCGSSLFYRVTAPGPHQGDLHIGFGGLDDQDGMQLESEIFSDLKPDAYSFANATEKMTAEQVMAMFAAADTTEDPPRT